MGAHWNQTDDAISMSTHNTFFCEETGKISTLLRVKIRAMRKNKNPKETSPQNAICRIAAFGREGHKKVTIRK